MKICIIKLGADGDVLRTLPIAKALKDKHKDAEITWITRGDIADLLENIPYIKKVIKIPYTEDEKFNLLYNFDIENAAFSLANEIQAAKKYGFCQAEGYPASFNIGAEYYLNTVFDDELKKKNKKTYQEMMFEAAEIPYKKERYSIILTEKDRKYAGDFFKNNSLPEKKIIGVHIGASPRWPSKVWAKEKLKDFIIRAKEARYEIILFGGLNEVKSQKEVVEELRKDGISIYQNNSQNTKSQFAALVDICHVVLCSDSFALHVSLGLGKKTICLFFCTSPNEVEGYGLLTKVVSPILYNFFPERSDEYNEELINSISVDEVIKRVTE